MGCNAPPAYQSVRAVSTVARVNSYPRSLNALCAIVSIKSSVAGPPHLYERTAKSLAMCLGTGRLSFSQNVYDVLKPGHKF